jgi:hypothetical protein
VWLALALDFVQLSGRAHWCAQFGQQAMKVEEVGSRVEKVELQLVAPFLVWLIHRYDLETSSIPLLKPRHSQLSS